MIGTLDRRVGRVAAAGLVVALSAGAAAQAQDAACDRLAATYLTTFTDVEGVFASRGLLTLLPGGAVIVTDSRQGGQSGVYDAFTVGQGGWLCDRPSEGETRFRAVSLTFTAPPSRSGAALGRVDYEGVIDPDTGRVEGTASLRLAHPHDLEGADPIDRPGEVQETFSFVGERVTVR